MKFRILITKEVIDKSLMCGNDDSIIASANCAFAVAYNLLIPNTMVGVEKVYFDKRNGSYLAKQSLSKDQAEFVETFDSMKSTPLQRYTLVGQTFDVEIPDEVIEYWHGDAVTAAQKLIDNPIMQLAS